MNNQFDDFLNHKRITAAHFLTSKCLQEENVLAAVVYVLSLNVQLFPKRQRLDLENMFVNNFYPLKIVCLGVGGVGAEVWGGGCTNVSWSIFWLHKNGMALMCFNNKSIFYNFSRFVQLSNLL